MTQSPIVVQAALGGPADGILASEAVPATDEHVVEDAFAAWQAGAAIVRIRAWESNGMPSGRAERFASLIEGIRAAGCEAILNLHHHPSHETADEDDHDYLVLKPELASLDCRVGAGTRAADRGMRRLRKAASAFLEAGTAPELQCSDGAHIGTASMLRDEGLLCDPLRFQLIVAGREGGRPMIERLMRMTSLLPPDAVWSVTSPGLAQLRINVMGLLLGGHARTGLEDTPWLVQDVAATNEELVQRLVRVVDELDRPLATPEEARELLALPPVPAWSRREPDSESRAPVDLELTPG